MLPYASVVKQGSESMTSHVPSTLKAIGLFTVMLCHARVLYCWMIGPILDSRLHTKDAYKGSVLSVIIHTMGWHTTKLLRRLPDTV